MTVYRHGEKWMFDFWKNSRRQRKGGYRTKTQAMIAEAEARKNLKAMNSGFTELCESRLKDVEKRRSPKYFLDNERLIKNLILKWNAKKEITRKDVEGYLNQIESPFVANKDLRLIKALFNHGIEREFITYNPADKIKYFPVHKEKKYIPSDEDVQKLLSVAGEHKPYLLTLINTMARIGEINHLKWEDVHEDYLLLKTRKSKNSNLSERHIPFNSTLKEVFSKLPRCGEYVFTNPVTRKPYNYRSKILTSLCHKTKIKRFTWHSLRHYGATRLDQANVALCDIQALLGHAQPTTTAIYLQSIRKSVKEAMAKLEVTT